MTNCLTKAVLGSLRTSLRASSLNRFVHETVSNGTINVTVAAPVRSLSVENRPRPASADGRLQRYCRKSTFFRKASTAGSAQPGNSNFAGSVAQLLPSLIGVRTSKTRDTLVLDFADADFNSHSLLDSLKGGLREQVSDDAPNKICLNHIPEHIYMNEINRLMKRLGYSGNFSRYNHGDGKATFVKPTEKGPNTWECASNYFRSGKPNRVL